MPNLHGRIEALARAFVHAVVEAVLRPSVAELVSFVDEPASTMRPNRVSRETHPWVSTTQVVRRVRTHRRTRLSPAEKRAGVVASATYPHPRSIVFAIVAYVRKHPGSSPRDIQTALRIGQFSWNRAVAEAVEDRLVRRHGKTRGATYYVGPLA